VRRSTITALVWAEGRPLDVAPRLLGAVIRHGGVAVRLTEVEAYDGANDPGSHAYRGPTRRNATMFGPPGRLYVYLSHGLHHCANLVTGPDGDPGAVLLRAGEVVDGHALARERRGGVTTRDLARGPGRLGQALGLTLADDGLQPDLTPPPVAVPYLSGPRVGLTLAADEPWRFWIEGDRFVSPYRRSPRAPRPEQA
jgi:DNA-3-methyladenine glycosylase